MQQELVRHGNYSDYSSSSFFMVLEDHHMEESLTKDLDFKYFLCSHGRPEDLLRYFTEMDFNKYYFYCVCEANRMDLVRLFLSKNDSKVLLGENYFHLFDFCLYKKHYDLVHFLLDFLMDPEDRIVIFRIVKILLHQDTEAILPLLEKMETRFKISGYFPSTFFIQSGFPFCEPLLDWILGTIRPRHNTDRALILGVMACSFEKYESKILENVLQEIPAEPALQVLLQKGQKENFSKLMEILPTSTLLDYEDLVESCLQSELPIQNLGWFLENYYLSRKHELKNPLNMIRILSKLVFYDSFRDLFFWISDKFSKEMLPKEDFYFMVMETNDILLMEWLLEKEGWDTMKKFIGFTLLPLLQTVLSWTSLSFYQKVMGDDWVITDDMYWCIMYNYGSRDWIEIKIPEEFLNHVPLDVQYIVDYEIFDVMADWSPGECQQIHEKNSMLFGPIARECLDGAAYHHNLPLFLWILNRYSGIVEVNEATLSSFIQYGWLDGLKWWISTCKESIQLEICDRLLFQAGKANQIKMVDLLISLFPKRYVYEIKDGLLVRDLDYHVVPKISLMIQIPLIGKPIIRLWEEESSKECIICFDNYPDVQTNCGHIFCRKCILQCFQQKDHTQCPYCRQSVTECQKIKWIKNEEKSSNEVKNLFIS